MICTNCGNAITCIDKGGLEYTRCTGCGLGGYAA